MITRIEATRYRCFDQIDVELGDFRVLVGANGSGKTTLLDIPVLIGALSRERNLASAFLERQDGRAPRATSLSELVFQGQGDSFILAVECALPERVTRDLLEGATAMIRDRQDLWPTHLRYEIRFQLFDKADLQVQNEYLFTFPSAQSPARPTPSGGAPRLQGETKPKKAWRFVVRREYGGDAEYRPETQLRPKGMRSTVAPQQLALPRLQYESLGKFPAARWLLDLLMEDAVVFNPDWNDLRAASPPGLAKRLTTSGKSIPWLALELQRNDPERFQMWKEHVQLALPKVTDVSVHERDDDHHAYFRVRYGDRYDVPSSGLSDGTLRILVLTLFAYLPRIPRFLVAEEPENGIHPQAIEVVLQGLSSLYDSQVIVTSHSPIVLAHTEIAQLLAARLRSDGAAEIIRGADHPRMVDWKGEVSLSTLFAAGVLG